MPLVAESRYPGAEVMETLYLRDMKSLAEIARLLNVSKPTAFRWLRKAGVPARDARTSTMLSGKYGVQNEAHREKLRENIASIREHITEESREKQRQKMLGRTPPNKGVPMSEAQRQLLIKQRSDPEYRREASERNKGPKSHRWKGGIKSELARRLDTADWRRRRREVYERDGWLCQECGCKCLNSADAKSHPKRKIQAHHIVSRRDGGTDEMSNLVTLCMSCHHKLERLQDALPA